MYLIDTDTLSALISKAPSIELVRRFSETPAEVQFTSSITVGELYYSVHKSPGAERFRRKLEERVWPHVRILSFDRTAAEVHGRIRASLEKQGKPLSNPDLMIASIALAHDLILVTGNTKHFERIDELRIENWLAL